MAWARFDDKRHTNSKLVAACVRDPLKGLAANGLDANAITYCAANETDGFVPDGALLVIAPGMGPRQRAGIIDLLVEVGRWDREDDQEGYWIHDYLAFNQSRLDAEKKRAEERDKKARQRSKGAAVVDRNEQGQFVSPGDTRPRPTGTAARVPEGVPGGQCESGDSEVRGEEADPGNVLSDSQNDDVEGLAGKSAPAGSRATLRPAHMARGPGDVPRGVPRVSRGVSPAIPTRPDPTQGNSSSSEEPLSRPPAADDDDDDPRAQALRRLAERDLADREATKGPVRNPDAWLAKAVLQRETGRGDELDRLHREHPDWSPDQLADALDPEPSGDSPYVPTAEETRARQRAADEAYEAERAEDARRAAAADAVIEALTDDERTELRARAEAEVTVVGGRRPEVLVDAVMRRLALER